MANILLLNGPNLNLLGMREPEIYGNKNLNDVYSLVEPAIKNAGFGLDTFQSNAEHELIARIHDTLKNEVSFIVFNPAAFTHTSVALRDALLAVNVPFIEVHLSNVHGREEFRSHSFFSDIAIGVVSGFGIYSYELAVYAALNHLKQT